MGATLYVRLLYSIYREARSLGKLPPESLHHIPSIGCPKDVSKKSASGDTTALANLTEDLHIVLWQKKLIVLSRCSNHSKGIFVHPTMANLERLEAHTGGIDIVWKMAKTNIPLSLEMMFKHAHMEDLSSSNVESASHDK